MWGGFSVSIGAHAVPRLRFWLRRQERSWTGRRAPYETITGPPRGPGHGGRVDHLGHLERGRPADPDHPGTAESRAAQAMLTLSAAVRRLRPPRGAASVAGPGPGHPHRRPQNH